MLGIRNKKAFKDIFVNGDATFLLNGQSLEINTKHTPVEVPFFEF